MKADFYYPLKLSYIPKETIWGGDKLSKRFGKGILDSLGETWELSVRENEKSIITNGPLAGLSLNEYIDHYTERSSKGFPILIKFIDAADKLSVQVHPDDPHAQLVGEKNGKSEMWYILEAEENATIIYGADPRSSFEQLETAALTGNLEHHLNKVNVSPGDVYFIPGGLVHAIGKGILLAEIQQNSDTTYRFYDYDRIDKNGNCRELHTEQALKALRCYSDEKIESIRFSVSREMYGGEPLVSCEYFTVTKHIISGTKHFHIKNDPFISLLCVGGEGVIEWKNGSEKVSVGDSYYIPDKLYAFNISGDLELLITTV